jgi:hypothetical protein
MRYGLQSENEAKQRFRFISEPLWRAYIFTYHVGRELLGQWINLAPPSERKARFKQLLIEQITPSDVRKWVAKETGKG